MSVFQYVKPRAIRCETASGSYIVLERTRVVIAHHLIWTAYGYWLPNDPRGSMSKVIACDVIAELGELHVGRKKVQPSAREVVEFRNQSRSALKHVLLDFRIQDFPVIANALAEVIREYRYTCYACAIMPDHVHILIRKHKHQAEEMLDNFQQISRLRLRNVGLRSETHPIWGGHGWKVFLDTPTDIRRTIRYIDENPARWRLARQQWSFVTDYNGWPLHPGHCPNSPYVKSMQTRVE
jgi:REP element-mobilizing transposase RayT